MSTKISNNGRACIEQVKACKERNCQAHHLGGGRERGRLIRIMNCFKGSDRIPGTQIFPQGHFTLAAQVSMTAMAMEKTSYRVCDI